MSISLAFLVVSVLVVVVVSVLAVSVFASCAKAGAATATSSDSTSVRMVSLLFLERGRDFLADDACQLGRRGEDRGAHRTLGIIDLDVAAGRGRRARDDDFFRSRWAERGRRRRRHA